MQTMSMKFITLFVKLFSRTLYPRTFSYSESPCVSDSQTHMVIFVAAVCSYENRLAFLCMNSPQERSIRGDMIQLPKLSEVINEVSSALQLFSPNRTGRENKRS